MTELPALPVSEIRPFVPYVWERSRSYYHRVGDTKEKRVEHHAEPLLDKVISERQITQLELSSGNSDKVFHQRRNFPIYFNRENTVILNHKDHQDDDLHRHQGRLVFVRQNEATNLSPVKLNRIRTSSKTRCLTVNGVQLPTEDLNRRLRKEQARKFLEFWQPETQNDTVKSLERNRTTYWFRDNPNAQQLELPKVNLTHTENSTTSLSQQLAKETLRGPKEETSLGFRLMVCSIPLTLSTSNPVFVNSANQSILGGGLGQPGMQSVAVTAPTKLAQLPSRYAALSISSDPTIGELSLRQGQRANRQPLIIKKQSPEPFLERRNGRLSYPDNFARAILTFEEK